MRRGMEAIRTLAQRTEEEVAMLRDRLLPRQRALSDKPDAVMKDPAAKNRIDGALRSCP